MPAAAPTRVGLVGVGRMARYHLTTMLDRADAVVTAMREPAAAAWADASTEFTVRGLAPVLNEPDWERFITHVADSLDAVLISTPHALHHDRAVACLDGHETHPPTTTPTSGGSSPTRSTGPQRPAARCRPTAIDRSPSSRSEVS